MATLQLRSVAVISPLYNKEADLTAGVASSPRRGQRIDVQVGKLDVCQVKIRVLHQARFAKCNAHRVTCTRTNALIFTAQLIDVAVSDVDVCSPAVVVNYSVCRLHGQSHHLLILCNR